MLVLAGTALIGGLENIGMAEYRRNLVYRFEFKLRIISRILSSLLTIGMAFLLQDYRALLIGTVVNKVMTVALSYHFHAHRPRPTLSVHPKTS